MLRTLYEIYEENVYQRNQKLYFSINAGVFSALSSLMGSTMLSLLGYANPSVIEAAILSSIGTATIHHTIPRLSKHGLFSRIMKESNGDDIELFKELYSKNLIGSFISYELFSMLVSSPLSLTDVFSSGLIGSPIIFGLMIGYDKYIRNSPPIAEMLGEYFGENLQETSQFRNSL